MAKSRVSDLPVIVQSSEAGVRERANAMGAAFADKESESLSRELSVFSRKTWASAPSSFGIPRGA